MDIYFRKVQHSYEKLMENSTVVTNPEFTRTSILIFLTVKQMEFMS